MVRSFVKVFLPFSGPVAFLVFSFQQLPDVPLPQVDLICTII